MVTISKVINVRTRNNEFQHIEVLKRNRGKRAKYNEFFVEGVQSINRLVENDFWRINSFVYTLDVPMSDWAKAVLKNSRAEKHIELSSELMKELSDKEDMSEVLATVAIPDDDLSRIKIHDKLLLVIFDRPSNYGNLGTIIRACDSLKADGLIITGHCVDLYDVQTIRASVGSIFKVPVIRIFSSKDLAPWFSRIKKSFGDFAIVGTDEKAKYDIIDYDFTAPTAFVLGNETTGMSKAYRELCNATIKIPIYGSASSLNVACTAAIVLYEIDRQRRNYV